MQQNNQSQAYNNVINQYQKRLQKLPKQDKNLQQQIFKYQDLVQDQQKQIALQNIKLKAFQSDLIKLDKLIQTRQNQIQALSQSQQKNAIKEKKYFMQIQNYNKKIQTSKAQTLKIQKSIQLLKKDTKTLQSTIVTVNSQKNKLLQGLTKQQIKINNMTQTLNDLKMKLMEQHTVKDFNQDDSKRDQKQIGQLFTAIKKQMALIDVLKRQKVHIVASTVFKYCQEQFQQVLQMNKTK